MQDANSRIMYSSIAYVAMIVLRPHTPGLQFGGKAISFEDPYQGLLYHFLITRSLCYGCFQQYFLIPGLSTIQVPADPARPTENLQLSNCQKVNDASIAKEKELLQYLEDMKMPVSNFQVHFFKTPEVIPQLLETRRAKDHDDFEPFPEFDFTEGEDFSGAVVHERRQRGERIGLIIECDSNNELKGNLPLFD